MSRIAKQLKHHRAGGGNHRRRNVIAASLAAIVLVAAGLAAALLPSRGGAGRNTLRVAARTDVISYLDANGITAYIENKAEIDIQWLDYGTINVAGRVAQDASAAPKELPDAYLGLGLTGEELSALNESAFLNIMNMYQTESNELKTFLAQDTSRLSEMYSGGGIYSYPTLDEESFAAQYPQKLWINAEWLNKLGLAMPATTDELYVVLKAFREGDPNGNGAADEIPLGIAYNGTGNSGFGFLINAFITTDFDMSETGNYLNVSDGGEVYCAAAEPAFERALTYIQRLFREGLVSADAFELGRETFLDGGATEIYGVVAAPDIYNAFNSMGRADSFEPLPPLYGENRATAPRRAPITLGGYMIAKNTQKYALAFKLGDAMLSAEGTLSLIYGAEGTGWIPADSRVASLGGGETTWKLLAPAQLVLPAALPRWYSAELASSRQAEMDANGEVNLRTVENWQGYLNKITRESYEPVGRATLKNTLPRLILSASADAELSEFGSNARQEIFEYMLSETRRLVTTDADISAQFPTFVEGLRGKGLYKLIELTQSAYDER